jgi:hypothetical protein
MLTRSKVAYNLGISPHRFETKYGNDDVTYVFSSDLYKRKFIERLVENRQSINSSLTNRFGYECVINELCDLKLYSSIEKRGFLVIVNNEEIICQENITLGGQIVITRS